MAGGVGAIPGLGQKGLPLGAGQAVVVPVGAGVFAAVVEEALVVVLRLQRRDLGFDEAVKLVQIGGHVRRHVEIHRRSSCFRHYERGEEAFAIVTRGNASRRRSRALGLAWACRDHVWAVTKQRVTDVLNPL